MQQPFKRLIRASAGDLAKLISGLDPTDSISVDAFGAYFYDLLHDAHGQAAGLGRAWSRGEAFSLTPEDRRVGRGIADTESDYLAGFLDDLDAGRYTRDDGSLNVGAVKARANQYVSRLRGTANEQFVLNSDADDDFKWQLGAAEHCADCLELAALSPFAIYELHTMPGNGDTECRANCGCEVIRIRDGKRGFKRV